MVMIRRYPSSLLVGFAAGASLWAIANALLLSWIPLGEAAYGLDDDEAVGEIARYLAWMALLVLLQTPAAGVLTTLYLGQAVFEKRPTWTSVFGEAKRQFWRWMWVLGLRRFPDPGDDPARVSMGSARFSVLGRVGSDRFPAHRRRSSGAAARSSPRYCCLNNARSAATPTR